ncbi:MAG: phosphate ABC transporter ATP-binding protein PstB [candidate division WOR-3 bacterium]|jgi:phosphate transport system ATP-binding protein
MVNEKIKVENFNLYFNDKQVLKNINLSIYEKKVTAIIGPSGCGKSTLIRSFNRMNDFYNAKVEGKIIFDGMNINDKNVDLSLLRTKIGMVFQKPNPFPFSIYENVAFGLKVKGIKDKSFLDQKVVKSLKDVWLYDEVKDRLFDSALSLSGGQQQRLCIARALANDPEVLLLDEPTSALDPKSTQKIEELLEVLKEKLTIIIVTHNIAQAGRVSDYTLFIYLGEIVEFGETKKMFTAPENKRTEEYITGIFG